MSVPLYSALALLLIILLYPRIQYSNPDEYGELLKEVNLLEQEIEGLEAENEIENLQRIFGFYFDKKLWSQASDLLTDNASVEIGGDGVYLGKDRILEYFRTLGLEGPEEGVLNDFMQLQPIIHVISKTEAMGRWHLFSQAACIYVIEFTKQINVTSLLPGYANLSCINEY